MKVQILLHKEIVCFLLCYCQYGESVFDLEVRLNGVLSSKWYQMYTICRHTI